MRPSKKTVSLVVFALILVFVVLAAQQVLSGPPREGFQTSDGPNWMLIGGGIAVVLVMLFLFMSFRGAAKNANAAYNAAKAANAAAPAPAPQAGGRRR